MKSLIFFYLLAITIINPIGNTHENHDQQIHNWSNSINKTIKSDSSSNSEKLENKNNKIKNHTKKSWIKILKDKSNS